MNNFDAHILVVDDDDGIRNLVKKYLNENNYLITTAKDAKDADEKIKIMDQLSLSSNQTGLDDLETKDIQNSIFSLSERFGICLGFYRCSKDDYLQIINNYSKSFQIEEDIKADALSWSILKGGYSGRIAFQFFIDYFNRR